MSCQSPLFQTPYNAENDLLTNSKYYGLYISKNDVSINAANEKLNVLITNDNGISIYMWIGGSSFPSEDKDRFDISNSAIDGEFPHYAFNNNEVVGKFSIINQNVINISFATLFQPYLNIQNVACNKYVTTAKN
ncbi:hypothetical protein R4I97_10275 [Brachyspira pilosicoli]|uniref:hypothetical protein n=1 Tax=Brachyspira pilosicoli TaxID=52584 RepID=UPI003004F16C